MGAASGGALPSRRLLLCLSFSMVPSVQPFRHILLVRTLLGSRKALVAAET